MTAHSTPAPTRAPATDYQRPAQSLKKNSLWVATGQLTSAACQWGIVALIAKTSDPATVGQYALAAALTIPVFQFFSLQLRGLQATDAIGRHSFPDYLTLRVTTTVCMLAVLFGLALAQEYDRGTTLILMLFSLQVAILGVADVFYGLFQQRERMELVGQPLIMTGVLTLILFTVAYLPTRSVAIGLAGSIVGAILPICFFIVPALKRLAPRHRHADLSIALRWNAMSIRRLAVAGIPLGFVSLLTALNVNVPRLFIESELGQHELGIFAALAYPIAAGTTIMSAIGQAASPRLSQYYAAGRGDSFHKLLMQLVGLGLTLGAFGTIISLVLGRSLLTLFYAAEYGNHVMVLVVLSSAAGVTFSASFISFGLIAAHYHGVQVPVGVAVAVVASLSSAYLVPTFGLIGGALAVLITAAVQLLISLVVVQRAIKNLCAKDTHDQLAPLN